MSLERLNNAIETFGSKIAVPMVLQGTACAKYCMESVTIRPGETCTEDQFETILMLCKKYNASDVLVRVTHPSDWKGAVDVFQTIRCEIYDIDSIQSAISKARRGAQEPLVRAYIDAEYAQRKENKQYDPKEIYIQIVPVLSEKGGLVTEHPDFRNVDFIDLTTDDDDYAHIETHGVVEGQILRTCHDEDEILTIVEMKNAVRSALDLDLDAAYQYEIGRKDDQMYVHQIREFARSSTRGILHTPCKIRNSQELKLFGTFEGNARVCKGTRFDKTSDGERQQEPYILAPITSNELGLRYDQLFPRHMVGFVPQMPRDLTAARKGSFVHENTRFAQAALRNGGFVDLRRDNGFDSLKDKEMTHVVCDKGTVTYSPPTQ